MTIRLYGETRIDTEQGDRSPGRAKERALLALLALRPNQSVAADQIVEALWPDDPSVGRRSLPVRVSNLRKALDQAATIDSVDGGYRLAIDEREIDMLRFASLVARAAAETDDASRRLLLERAIDLRTDEPLIELTYTDFAIGAIERDLEAVARTSEMLARLEAAEGDVETAVMRLHQAIERRPWDEGLVGARMEMLAALGRVGDALSEFEALAARLAERGLAPSPELTSLEERILLGESTRELPPPRPIWGRADDLSALDALLSERQVVTVVGPPGVGKTTLALEFAHDWMGPIQWVSLAEVEGPDAASQARAAIAAVAGDHRSGGLVVLDNCEHVRDEVAPTIQGIDPAVRVLATSRVVLGDEQQYALAALPIPAGDDDPNASVHSAAVRIFSERARLSDPGFRLEDHLEDVIALCSALDGLPLAIELAASRSVIMTPAQILERMPGGDEMGSESSPLPAALAAAIRWSVEGLSEGARDLFARLSVCAGRFDLDLAETLGAGAGGSLHDTLAELVRHSLVQRGEDGMFHVLGVVGTVAAELRIDRDREIRAHAEHIATLAAAAGDVSDRATFDAACATLEMHAGNVRLAIVRCAERNPALGAQILADSWRWWHGSGRWTEGAALHRAVLSHAVPAGRQARLEYLNAACRLLLFGGGPEDLLFEVLDDADGLADALGRRRVHDVRGLALRMADRLDESIEVHLSEAAELEADGLSVRAALANIAAVRVLLGDLPGARRAAVQAIESAAEQGEAAFDTTPVTLAEVEFLDGEYESAIEVAEAWLRGAGVSDSGFRCEAMQATALSYLELGDRRGAADVLPDLLRLGSRLRGTHLSMVLVAAAVAARLVGDSDAAQDLVATAEAYDDMTPRPHITEYMRDIGSGSALPIKDALRAGYATARALVDD